MKNIHLYALSFIIGLSLWGCSPKHSDIVVADYGKSTITMSEFEKAYLKNSSATGKQSTDTLKQYENFLDLYVKYKMKLADAQKRGYDTNQALQNELIDYKKKVGVSFLLERNLVTPNIKRLWEMRKKEFRVSHLMIRPDSTGDEAAHKKALALVDSIKHGKTFEQMVSLYSQDTYSKNIGGDIYYITAGMLVPEFEEAVYKTKVGEIYPEPIKTRWGYHIIKVTEERERVPSVRASHILVDFTNENGEVDSVAAKKIIDTVAQKLKAGADFAELAKQYSKDQASKENGGDLNYFERRMMIKEFDEAAFNLKVGEISPIIKTSYGYHIIKLTDKKPYPAFEDDKENLKQLYRQARYNADYDTLVTSLKSNYQYSLNHATIDAVAKLSDSTKMTPDVFAAPWYPGVKDLSLFTMTNDNVKVDDFFNYAQNQADLSNKLITKTFMLDAIKKYSSEHVLELSAMTLESKNEEFAELMKDYKNGIFIFKLQDDEIWGKIAMDSVKLVQYYDLNKDKYRWNDRVEFAEIFVKSDSLIKAVQGELKSGVSFDTLVVKFTERPGFRDRGGKYPLADVNSSQLGLEANRLSNPGDVSAPVANSGGYSLLQLIKKEPARVKTFEEAKAEVSGAYQEEESKRLENEYNDTLQKEYKPVLHYDVLPQAFKQ